MIRISKLADYATMVMAFFAQHDEQYYSAAQIAAVCHIPPPTVMKLLKQLHEAQLVSSTRGMGGGYQLKRSADMISVKDIIAAIDGLPTITECSHGDTTCQLNDVCQLRGNWQFINYKILQLLSEISLLEMSNSSIKQSVMTVPVNLEKESE